MSISAKELAKKLNISAATVSMVFHNKPGISEKTRSTVIDAAKKYGYDFSKITALEASAGTIVFVIYKNHGTVVTDTPFFSQLIEGVNQACQLAGYELQIVYCYQNSSMNEYIDHIADKKCDGILLLGTELQSESFKLFSALNIPMVVLDTYFEELSCTSVLINNVQGAYLATKYLIEKGFCEVGYLHSSYEIGNFLEREEGYVKALNQYNLLETPQYVHLLSPSIEGAYQDMLQLLQHNKPVAKAYFADNDLIAAGAIKALKKYGYEIPRDISMIGFDNLPVCEITDPPLTTMDVSKSNIGKIAVEQLIKQMTSSNEQVIKIEISPVLYERDSVAQVKKKQAP